MEESDKEENQTTDSTPEKEQVTPEKPSEFDKSNFDPKNAEDQESFDESVSKVIDEAISNAGSLDLTHSNRSSRNRNYSLKFKLEVIKYAKEHSTNQASMVHKVPRKCVMEWRKGEDRIRYLSRANPERKRLTGGGRKGTEKSAAKKSINMLLDIFIEDQQNRLNRLAPTNGFGGKTEPDTSVTFLPSVCLTCQLCPADEPFQICLNSYTGMFPKMRFGCRKRLEEHVRIRHVGIRPESNAELLLGDREKQLVDNLIGGFPEFAELYRKHEQTNARMERNRRKQAMMRAKKTGMPDLNKESAKLKTRGCRDLESWVNQILPPVLGPMHDLVHGEDGAPYGVDCQGFSGHRDGVPGAVGHILEPATTSYMHNPSHYEAPVLSMPGIETEEFVQEVEVNGSLSAIPNLNQSSQGSGSNNNFSVRRIIIE